MNWFNEKKCSLGTFVKGPYMVVRQKAYALPSRDQCAEKNVSIIKRC